MKFWIGIGLAMVFGASAQGQVFKRAEHKSLLDSDPDVVYMDQVLKQPLELMVDKEAPVYSDKDGRVRLGFLKTAQKVKLEAMTAKVYKVRGQGTRDGIAGWVGPWAFSSNDPQFVEHLKKLYDRQIEVRKLLAAHDLAVGMTLEEVEQSRGKPTKTQIRKTSGGQSGRWEYIDFQQVPNYQTFRDPRSGQLVQQVVSYTQVEKGKTSVEFENGVVSAIEESESHKGGSVRIIVPPIVFGM